MAARKKKRELSEKAQKRIRQRNLHVGITEIGRASCRERV